MNVISPDDFLVSTGNSTSSPLAAGSTYTGTGEQNDFIDITVSVSTDRFGTIYLEFSEDNENWATSISGPINPNNQEKFTLKKGGEYFRVRLTNTSNKPQSRLKLSTVYSSSQPQISTLNSAISADQDSFIARNVSEETTFSEGHFEDRFVVNKFARNGDVDGPEDIWNGGGIYTGFPKTGAAETLGISSASNADTYPTGAGARQLRIFGLDNTFSLQQEDVYLSGTTEVFTTGLYRRMFRGFVVTAGDDESNQGSITVRHSSTTDNVFAVLPQYFGQTELSNYTVPSGYTAYLKNYNASMLDNNNNRAEIALWVREKDGAARLQRPFILSTDQTISRSVFGGVRLPEMTDIKFRVLSVSNGGADITITWDAVVVKNSSL